MADEIRPFVSGDVIEVRYRGKDFVEIYIGISGNGLVVYKDPEPGNEKGHKVYQLNEVGIRLIRRGQAPDGL